MVDITPFIAVTGNNAEESALNKREVIIEYTPHKLDGTTAEGNARMETIMRNMF